METLASVPHVRSVMLSHGKLAVQEEFPDAVAEAVRSFLRRDAVVSQLTDENMESASMSALPSRADMLRAATNVR